MASGYELGDIDVLKEKKAKYELLLQDASKEYLDKHYKEASKLYNDASSLAQDLKLSKIVTAILKYTISLCLLKSNHLEDLSEAIMILQSLEKPVKERLPAIYCLLAQAHCKLFRFQEAAECIKEGEIIYNKNPLLETYYIPGTTITINQSSTDESWIRIKEESVSWHKPDAICSLSECRNICRPYVTASKLIFLSDPAFNGMVIVNCNNKNRPCNLKFHKYCWKYKKDEMYPIQKISDKDMLGNNCFTPNCESLISSIEIVGKNLEVKSHIKENNISWPMVKHNASKESKGAIKKVKINTPTKKHCKPKTTVPLQSNKHHEVYTNDSIIVINYHAQPVDFTDESPEMSSAKLFLFTLFYNYMEDNLVTVSDIYSKFNEIHEDIPLKDIDIVRFLLETNNFSVLDNDPESESDNIQDINDVYDELVNDDDTNHNEQCNQDQCKNPQPNYNTELQNEVGDGDASSQLRNDTEFFNNDAGKRGSANRKLKEYIARLESDMCEIRNENCNLKKDIKDKGSVIESLTNYQEEYIKKVKMCESLLEALNDFQKRYRVIKEENLNLKEEAIKLIEDKKKLEDQLLLNKEMETQSRKDNFLKTFQEEYKILEETIAMEWKEKLEKVKEDREMKITLVNKFINAQYTGQKHLLNKYMDNNILTLKVINAINIWMEKAIGVQKLLDNSEWLMRLKQLQSIAVMHQQHYSKLLAELHSDSEEKYQKEYDIVLPEVPNPPKNTLEDIVLYAFNCLFKKQSQFMEIMKKPPLPILPMQPMPMAYPFSGPPVYPNYAQFPFGVASTMQPPIVQRPYQNFIHSIPETTKTIAINEENDKQSVPETKNNKREDEAKVDKSEDEAKVNKSEDEAIISKEPNQLNVRIKEMRKAMKAIALNVQQKCADSTSEDEQTKIVRPKEGRKKSVDNYCSDSSQNSMQKENSKPVKIIGGGELLKLMLQKHPESLESDIIGIISDIRKRHNDSLSGIPIKQILNESKTYFTENQRLHMLDIISSSHGGQLMTFTAALSGFDQSIMIKDSDSSAFSSHTSTKKGWNCLPNKIQWMNTSSEIECSICMNVVKKDNCYTLNCQHSFHLKCVKPWLKLERSCPNCRVMVTEDEDFPPLPA